MQCVAAEFQRLSNDLSFFERSLQRHKPIALDAGHSDSAALDAFIGAVVWAVAVHSAAVIDAQLVADLNRIVVGERLVESVPASGRAEREEDAAVGDAREIHSITANGQLNV